MTDQLQKDARTFLAEVEEEVKAECQQSAGDEIARLNAAHAAEIEALNAAHAAETEALNAAHAAEISKMQADFDVRIVQERERYYNEGFADGKTDHSQEAGGTAADKDEPAPDPGDVPAPEPEGCTDAKVRTSLLALLGDKKSVFGIVDAQGRAYATADEYCRAGSPVPLGVGYTDGTLFLCMGAREIAAAAFGGNGVNFGSSVYATSAQWGKDDKPNAPSAFNDYSGAKSTEGLVSGCSDSIAARCRDVVFANGKHGYMPACGELRLFTRSAAQVDALLEVIQGDKLIFKAGAHQMHAATLNPKTTLCYWGVRYSTTSSQPESHSRTSMLRTRTFVEI